MSLRIKHFDFSSLADDFKLGLKDYLSLYKNGIPLKNLLKNQSYISNIISGRTPSKFNPEYWNGEYDFITMSDVDTTTFSLNEIIEEHITDEAIANEKNIVQVTKGSLLISNAMTIGLAFIADKDVYINQNVFWVDIDPLLVNPKFLLWYFNCYVKKVFQDVYSAKYLSKQELSRINIPMIDIALQNEFEDKIKPIEKRMLELKASMKSTSTIINDIFAGYFHYDFDKFDDLKKQKIYQANFASYGNNIDTRFSVKFHRPAGEFVYSELKKSDYYKLKNVVSVPMITGQGISNEYDENGTCAYISMADISTWKLDSTGLKTVSVEYEKKNQIKKIKGLTEPQSTKLAINDIIMMRSGEGGIGKVAIVKDEIDAIFCDFLIRIRFDESIINPMFAYYYFRTTYFQYLVEINKKGLGNNTNIFPNILNEFPIPDIDIKEQEKIVSRIEEKIQEQEAIKEKIAAERKKIDDILNGLLKQ